MSVVPPAVPHEPAAASAADDPVPVDLRAVIDLFGTELAKITFPDVDVALLRRQADELRTGATAVTRAREALEAALAAQATRAAVLADTAARGVAYARIYADAHPERQGLAAALAALVEAKPAVPAAVPASGKRRGRPPRQSPELVFAATATAGAAAAEEPA